LPWLVAEAVYQVSALGIQQKTTILESGKESLETKHVISRQRGFQRLDSENSVPVGIAIDQTMRFEFGLDQDLLGFDHFDLIENVQEFALDPRGHRNPPIERSAIGPRSCYRAVNPFTNGQGSRPVAEMKEP
jgi:hypothetical protein